MKPPTELSRRAGRELVIAVAFVGGSAVVGGLAGAIWAHFASHLSLLRQFDFQPAVDHRVFGQQLLYAEMMIGAAVIMLLMVSLLMRWSSMTRRWSTGPGAILGLAGGGLTGSLVAAAIGHNRRLAPFLVAYGKAIPADLDHVTKLYYLHTFEFKLHAVALIVVWPLVVTIVHGIRCYAQADDLAEIYSAPSGGRLDKLLHRAVTD